MESRRQTKAETLQPNWEGGRGLLPRRPPTPALRQGPESLRTPQGWRSGLRGISSPVQARALKESVDSPGLEEQAPRDLLTSPALLQGLARPAPSQRSPCSPHPTQKQGRGALSWSLQLTARHDEPGFLCWSAPRARGRPSIGSDAERREGYAQRRLSSLSTSTSAQTPTFPRTARQVSMTAPNKPAEGRKQA